MFFNGPYIKVQWVNLSTNHWKKIKRCDHNLYVDPTLPCSADSSRNCFPVPQPCFENHALPASKSPKSLKSCRTTLWFWYGFPGSHNCFPVPWPFTSHGGMILGHLGLSEIFIFRTGPPGKKLPVQPGILILTGNQWGGDLKRWPKSFTNVYKYPLISGKLTCFGTWPFIVSFPIQNI